MPNPENVVPYGKHNHRMAQFGGPEAYDRMVYSFGFEDGHQDGYSDGYHDGHDDGHSTGFLEGYDDGFQKGSLIVAIAALAFCGLSHFLRTKWQEHKMRLEAAQTTIMEPSNFDAFIDNEPTSPTTNSASSVTCGDDATQKAS